jgi:hypothetical protein
MADENQKLVEEKAEGAEGELAKKEKQQTAISVLGVLVVIALLLGLVIRPAWSKITQLKIDIEGNEQQLVAMQNKINVLKTAQENYNLVSGDLRVISEAVPDYSDVPQVMAILEKLGGEVVEEGGPFLITKIAVATMPNDKPANLGLVSAGSGQKRERSEVSLTISATGDYQAIRDYVVKLRSLRHNFYVEKLTLSLPDEDTQFLNTVITLKYYYFG